MSLFCINKQLCEQQAYIDELCAKNDELAAANEAICDKVAALVGDPDAECPPCAEPTPLVEEAMEQTAAIKAVTVAVKAQTAAVKTSLGAKTIKPVATPPVRG